MNQSAQTPAQPQGHAQAASPAGNGQVQLPPQYDIGAFNGVGVNPNQIIAQHQQSQQTATNNTAVATLTPTTQEIPGQQETTLGTQTTTRQLTEKDERHFAKHITKVSQEKYDIAKLAIETDAEAIYKIAETDKDLAERLLKEYDYGTTKVDELLEQRDISKSAKPEEAQKLLDDAKWKSQMEKDLMEEKLKRLKGENPDLHGDVEEKFREVYSDPAFSKYDETQKLAIARTLSGSSSQQSSADDVALAILKQQEGITSSPRGASTPEKMKQYSPEFKQMQKSMGVSDKDLELLPPDIDDLIANSLSALGGVK